MTARTLPLLACLALVTLLAGCLGGGYIDPNDPMRDGTPRRDVLYQHVWAGNSRSDDAVEIREDYDYLVTDWTHSGHAIGGPTYTAPGGRAMDESPFSSASGVTALHRVLPPDVGTAKVSMPASARGAGTYVVTGVDNIPPSALLTAVWTERTDGYGPLETKAHFYVPPGYQHLAITLTAAGSFNAGIKVSDPEGETRAELGPTSVGASTSGPTAEPGIWTLHLNGMYRGAFSVNIQPR